MRKSARFYSFAHFFSSFLVAVIAFFAFLISSASPAAAQTPQPTITVPPAATYNDYRTPDVDPNVPRNHHTYTQIVLLDVLSAITCQITGIDPIDRSTPCLGINPTTNKIGYAQNQLGQASEPQVGGALGMVGSMISTMYTPTVSSTQYVHYLSSNFGIVKTANAQAAPAPQPAGTEGCSKSPFGYGFCGLQPIFTLWTHARDFSYALLVIAFVGLGIGIMTRFKVDPRTVMNLQNQIPRVIIAIILITFSYAIAGIMIDLMWTVTYAGINMIASTAPAADRKPEELQIALDCDSTPPNLKSIPEGASQSLINQPIGFVDTIFRWDCGGGALVGAGGTAERAGNPDSGIMKLSARVSDSFGGLITDILNAALGVDLQGLDCGLSKPEDCVGEVLMFITGIIIGLIIAVALLIALLRLWFELIKTYVTLLIFIILGPVWIVLGLVPGRPLGFERWLRIIFANLAAFPLVAFIIIFARVIVTAIPEQPTPENMFIPPLIGNPNMAHFSVLIGFGALLLAPTIPALIKEKMKAAGSGKYGAHIAGNLSAAVGATTSVPTRVYKSWTRKEADGTPGGTLSRWRHNLGEKIGGPVTYFRKRNADAKQDYSNKYGHRK